MCSTRFVLLIPLLSRSSSQIVSRQFDFVYLRFDFKNQCNVIAVPSTGVSSNHSQVGYAFVNFTSVRALYEFYDAKVGRKWNMFSSDKVLQVSSALPNEAKLTLLGLLCEYPVCWRVHVGIRN